MSPDHVRKFTLTLLFLGATASSGAEPASTPERLAPIYRHTILVSDLERSLTLYRDVLGMRVSRINESGPDSYASVFFNIPKGAQKRFAYLDGAGGHERVLGIGEVPGVTFAAPAGARSSAFVQTVADIEAVMAGVEALGLKLLPPKEFVSRESGTVGIETGTIDFDGHLVMFYGLKKAP
jgi:catechol 2,3-dioxygenase-like lactoylglutathione lyase family enzyme